MKYEKMLEGRYCNLRTVELDDAEFTLAVRKDTSLTSYLPKLDITVEQQREWIKKQQADPTDYFFVVLDKEGSYIGVMGLYHVKDGEGETGRLAMKGNPLQAIEAQMLCVDFAFDVLGLEKLHSYIMEGNESALRFAKLFGADLSGPRKNEKGEIVINVANKRDLYRKQRPNLERMLYRDKRVGGGVKVF